MHLLKNELPSRRNGSVIQKTKDPKQKDKISCPLSGATRVRVNFFTELVLSYQTFFWQGGNATIL